MNKCEHGERISLFCASECCVWKEAAGCSHCMKKYHNHMGPTIFLQEEEAAELVRRYTLEGSIKPKCRTLQEALYSYFNLLKTELANSLDAASKNAINLVGYPYLATHNNLSSYKRLKNKEYRKLLQKDFRNLYESSLRVDEKELAREETRLYFEEVKKLEEAVNQLESAARTYETAIRKILASFNHDTSYINKVNEIIRTLNAESPQKARAKEKEISPVKVEAKQQASPEKQSPKLKNAAGSKENNDETPKVQHIIAPPPQLLKPNYARNASIDKKLIKENKFLSTPSKSLKEKEKEKEPTIKEVRLLNNDKLDQVRQELNSKEVEINEKKRMLIEMMKQKEESVRAKQITSAHDKKELPKPATPVYLRRQLSEQITMKDPPEVDKTHEAETTNIKTESEENSHYEFELFETGMKHNESEIQIKAFTQLPLEMQDLYKEEEKQEVKEKIIIVSKPKELESIAQKETTNNSPILKKRNSMAIKPQQLEPNLEDTEEEQLQKYQCVNHRMDSVELKENEEKSLALLLKSLTLNAQDGIHHLESALAQAENNLSAAEYLSYLYLEQDKPQNCLHLCNKMLEKLEHSAEAEELSLILNNNKAAALNILGRYSESILILERCLKFKEKDCLYKNLGDAYFQISIYEKAIYNYEKALVLNESYDEAQYNLAVCLYIQQNYHNARLAIEKAIALHPNNHDYARLLASIDTRITNY